MFSEQAEEYFSARGTVAKWWNPENNRWYKKQFEYFDYFGNFENKIVADIGTGKGRFAHYFAKKGAQGVYGLDISEEMLDIARRNAQRDGISGKIFFKQGNILDIELKNNFFDLICCMETLIHLRDPQKAVVKMAESLKKGGIIIANTDRVMLRLRIYRNIYYLLYWVNSCESLLNPLCYCKFLFFSKRLLSKLLFKPFPEMPYECESLDKFVSLRQLKTTKDTFEFLKQYPAADLLYPLDVLNFMPKEKFISLFSDAGLKIIKVIPEGHWFFPKGDIVIARKVC